MALGPPLGVGQVGTLFCHLGSGGEVCSNQVPGPHSHPGPQASLLGSVHSQGLASCMRGGSQSEATRL